MQSDRQARIKERAHQLWLDEGKVEGKHDEHWQRAEREIAAQEQTARGKGAKRSPAENGAVPEEKAAPAPARSRAKTTSPSANVKQSDSGSGKSAATARKPATSGGTTSARSRSRASAS
jgi:hypothetical protein